MAHTVYGLFRPLSQVCGQNSRSSERWVTETIDSCEQGCKGSPSGFSGDKNTNGNPGSLNPEGLRWEQELFWELDWRSHVQILAETNVCFFSVYNLNDMENNGAGHANLILIPHAGHRPPWLLIHKLFSPPVCFSSPACRTEKTAGTQDRQR